MIDNSNSFLQLIYQQQEEYKKGFAYLLSSQGQSDILKVANKIKQYDRILLIANGGSLVGCAQHFEEDCTKLYGIPCLTMSNVGMMSALANDEKFENIYKYWLDFHLTLGDLVIAISSSGKSANIIRGAKLVGQNNLITLTGFEKNNPLSTRGSINVWIDSTSYGVVESVSAAFLHMVLDVLVEERKILDNDSTTSKTVESPI